jgi:3-phenylpropionate/cinnamic acid dioxygenase small subunit
MTMPRIEDYLIDREAEGVYSTPSRRTDGTLTDNHMRELSHIYIAGNGGDEDRVFRLRSNLAASSIPIQRTTHVLSTPRFLDTRSTQAQAERDLGVDLAAAYRLVDKTDPIFRE